jgi:hypothetical protein
MAVSWIEWLEVDGMVRQFVCITPSRLESISLSLMSPRTSQGAIDPIAPNPGKS